MAIDSVPQPVSPAALDDFSQTLLDVSLTGYILFRPVYAEPGGAIQDLAYEHLNPAAQRMLRLPECPAETFLTLYPSARETGIFAFYAGAFHSGQTERYEVNYQYDGLDGFYYLVARRSGERLVVSFTDTNDHPRTAVEEALRHSQAREQTARAEAERQRQRFYEVLMQLPAQVAVYHGPDHIYQLVNPFYQRVFPHRTFLGQPFREGMPESEELGMVALFDQVYHTGEPYYGHEMEGWFDFGGNGKPEQFFFNLSLHPLRNTQGEVDGVLDFSYDVTEQVLARRQVQQLNQELEGRVAERTAQLAEQQNLLQQVLQQVPAAIATLSGPDHRFAFANAQYQELVGHRARLGQPVAEALPEIKDQGIVELLDQVYQSGEAYIGREVLVMLEQPPGPPHYAPYDLTYLPLRDGQGQVHSLLIFAVDVSEQVRSRRQAAVLQAELLATAQRKVQEREDLYQVFAQSQAVVLLTRGPEHYIEYLNAASERLFPGRYMWGRTVAESQPEVVAQGFMALLDHVYQTGETYRGTEVPLTVLDAAGQPVTTYLNFTYQAHREQGQVVGISAFAYDVTEQVRARQQVQDLNEELAAINQELTATNEELHASNTHLSRSNTDLGTFVYTASHDLKAPITNIEGLVAALRDTLPAAVQQDHLIAQLLGLLDTTVHRFLATITQLTDLSRLQRAYEEPVESLALAPVVSGVLADLAPTIAEAGATIQVQIPAALHLSFAPASLRSIVYNLLSNAVKYRAPQRPAQVWLRAARQPEGLVLTVADNGLGLTDSQQERLFQAFQRLHTHVDGTGVGLYMIKRLIENAGARIAVTSVPDEGTTFTVTFPL